MAINLLPWREQKQLNHGLCVIISVLISILMISSVILIDFAHLRTENLHLQYQIDDMQKEINQLPAINYPLAEQRFQKVLSEIKTIQSIRQKQIVFF